MTTVRGTVEQYIGENCDLHVYCIIGEWRLQDAVRATADPTNLIISRKENRTSPEDDPEITWITAILFLVVRKGPGAVFTIGTVSDIMDENKKC